MMSFKFQSSSETKPDRNWSKNIDSICFYASTRGDTIVTVTDRVTVLSLSGEIISKTLPLDYLKDLKDGQHSFCYLSDKTLLFIKNQYEITKLSLSGEKLWSKSLRDTIPDAVCNDFVEDNAGNLYLCGNVSYQSAFLISISHDGEILFCSDESSYGNFHSIALSDQIIYLVSSAPSSYFPSAILSFSMGGEFVGKFADDSTGTILALKDGHIYSLGSKDGAALFKTKFFATRDILLKKFDPNGVLLDSKVFDFGKYENPMGLVEQNDGLVMITSSDETVNMGTNILNYFITKIDENMQKKWQIHFGTDSSGLGGISQHKRTFFANYTGIILASHNDTLDMYTVTISPIFKPQIPSPVSQAENIWIYDLKGRMLPFNGKRFDPVANASAVYLQKKKTAIEAEKAIILMHIGK